MKYITIHHSRNIFSIFPFIQNLFKISAEVISQAHKQWFQKETQSHYNESCCEKSTESGKNKVFGYIFAGTIQSFPKSWPTGKFPLRSYHLPLDSPSFLYYLLSLHLAELSSKWEKDKQKQERKKLLENPFREKENSVLYLLAPSNYAQYFPRCLSNF